VVLLIALLRAIKLPISGKITVIYHFGDY